MVQIEGVLAVPSDAATADNDRAFFSEIVWNNATPNGQATAFDGRASRNDYDLAYFLERVAEF